MDTTKLSPGGDLIIGFFNGTALAGGFSGPVTFVLKNGSNILINQTFTTVAAANAFFDDNAMDLGAIGSGSLTGTTLSLTASLSVSVNAAGQGYFAQIIIGDPPVSTPHAASHAIVHFAQTMSTVGASLTSAMTAEPNAPPFTPLMTMGSSLTARA